LVHFGSNEGNESLISQASLANTLDGDGVKVRDDQVLQV
jgi:hypothetical protein